MAKTQTKKAQAALEFLMSYGWAVLVIIVIISGLAYFGVMNPKKQSTPNICLFNYGMACQDMRISSDAAVLFLTNSLGKDVVIMNITLESCSSAFDGLLLNGESKSYTISPCAFGAKDDLVSGDIRVYYNTSDGIEKMHQGTIKAAIE